MREVRRGICELVMEHSDGVILDPNEPLDKHASRILEALSAMQAEFNEREKNKEEMKELKSDNEDLADDVSSLEEEVASLKKQLKERKADEPIPV